MGRESDAVRSSEPAKLAIKRLLKIGWYLLTETPMKGCMRGNVLILTQGSNRLSPVASGFLGFSCESWTKSIITASLSSRDKAVKPKPAPN